MKNDGKEKLKKVKNEFNKSKNFGKKLQNEGIKIVKYSELGAKTAKQLGEHPSLLNKLPYKHWIDGSLSFFEHHAIPTFGSITSFTTNLGTYSTSAASVSYSELIPPFESIEKTDVEFINKEIDEYLKKFNKEFTNIGDLLAMRRGAWKTFYSVSDDALSQASNSVRLILDKVISQWAPNEEVIKAEWWKQQHKIGEKPSEKARLRYLIYGIKKVDKKTLTMIEAIVQKCYEKHKYLKKIAHGSKGYRDRVEEAMLATETTLLAIFNARYSQ